MTSPKQHLKRPSAIMKKNSAINAAPVPAFKTRRTLADHVKDNMLCAGKHSYHQRIIYVASHVVGTSENSLEIKRALNKIVKLINNVVEESEILTGLIIIYNSYSVYMLEGSEKYIGQFIMEIVNQFDKYFKCARIILIYNNINQVKNVIYIIF